MAGKSKTEVEMVSIYNKGRRVWPLKVNGEMFSCKPKSSIEVDEATAKRMVESYPIEFVYSSEIDKTTSLNAKKLKKQVDVLTAQVETLTTEKTELTAQVETLTTEIEEIKKASK